MDKGLYRFLVVTAIVLTLAWIGWSYYDSKIAPRNPGDPAYLAANKLFEDGDYQRALDKYDEALNETPNHIHAMRGRARSRMQLGQSTRALAEFNTAIALEPDFGPTYANRGILHDRQGRYGKAIADYERALELEPTDKKTRRLLGKLHRLRRDSAAAESVLLDDSGDPIDDEAAALSAFIRERG